MADKKKNVNPYDRFSTDDRAKDAKSAGLRDVRPPRKNRKPLPQPKKK